MSSDNGFGAAPEGAEQLYGWWFNAVPNLLSKLAPASGAGTAAPASNGAAPPFPVGQMTQALGVAKQIAAPLYEALFQALALNHPGQTFDWFEQLLQGRMGDMTDRLATISQALSVQPGLAGALGAGWANAPLAALAETMKPLSVNLERTYGGLADAFGLASSRELQQAMRDMATASMAHRQAQAEYLGLVAGGLAKGSDALMAKLAEMGQRGESIDSVKALVRLWARVADETMHTAMQAPGALEAAARLVRTATLSRKQQQRVIAIASQALNMPTRAEVDDAYREIQELKRELRRLRKSLAPEGASDEQAIALQPAATRKSRARTAPPAKSAGTRKTTTVRKATAARKTGRKSASA